MYPSLFPPHWFTRTSTSFPSSSYFPAFSPPPPFPPFLVNLSILSAPLIPVNSFFLFLSSCFYPSHFSPASPLHLPQLSSALMFDAVHVVVGAVRELNRSQEIGVKPLSCTSPQIWQHGTSLMNYLRMVKLHIYYMSKAGNKM